MLSRLPPNFFPIDITGCDTPQPFSHCHPLPLLAAQTFLQQKTRPPRHSHLAQNRMDRPSDLGTRTHPQKPASSPPPPPPRISHGSCGSRLKSFSSPIPPATHHSHTPPLHFPATSLAAPSFV